MKQLLIVGTTILAAGYFFDDEEELRVYADTELTVCDGIYPHHVMEGYRIAEAELPDDFNCAIYQWNGELVRKPDPVHYPDEEESKVIIQELLDSTAQQRQYDGILSACSYVTSTNPQFAAEAQACVNFRDGCWSTAYQILREVYDGTRTRPTKEQLLAEMPAIVWPA